MVCKHPECTGVHNLSRYHELCPDARERQKAYKRAWSKQAWLRKRAPRDTYFSDAERRSFAAAYKLERGCMDCGYDKIPEALEFDHTSDDKAFNISSKVTKLPLSQLLDEMKKCDVVCANCHRERTIGRRSEA